MLNEENRKKLKPEGLLTRDPEMLKEKSMAEKKLEKNSNFRNVKKNGKS